MLVQIEEEEEEEKDLYASRRKRRRVEGLFHKKQVHNNYGLTFSVYNYT